MFFFAFPASLRPARPRTLTLSLVALLAACSPPVDKLSSGKIVAATKDCGTERSGGCYFTDSPVALEGKAITLPGRPYVFFPTARGMRFVDGASREWTAPKATLTDGASIPPVFVPIVGSPRTTEFANAAAMHDAYCGIGNETGTSYHAAPWQEVHRMFYDTLVVGGTPAPKAQLMFAAVWLGGPRWHPHDGSLDRRLDRISDPVKTRALSETKAFIARETPDIDRLVSYLVWKDHEMQVWADLPGFGGPGRRHPDPNSGEGTSPEEPPPPPQEGGGSAGAVRP